MVNMQERTELALQASNEGVWDWYLNEEAIYYSERVLLFLGYDEVSAPNIFKYAKDYFHEEDLGHFHKALNHALLDQNDEVFASDCRYSHPDGHWHWLRIRGVIVRNELGEATRMVGSIIDISHRKKAELALEEERYRLKQLIENVPVNVYYKDTESRFVLANSSTIEKLGASTGDEVIGKTDHDFFDASHADSTRAKELEIMESRMPQLSEVHCETWVKIKGKDDTWAKSSKLPWIDKKGNVSGTFGITSDITDLVRTQRMLASAAKELQQRNIAFEEELQLAREIQQALLPQELNGLSLESEDKLVNFACRYAPASEMAGDFYEVMPISDHRVGVLVCDVMGHGVRASLVVSMLRGLIEKERASCEDPALFLQGVNEGLVSIMNRAEVTIFATAIYGVVDLQENMLTYACAGHPHPIQLKLNNEAHQLKPSQKKACPALGLIPNTSYLTETLSLEETKQILIFTDGLHEVENEAEEEFGIPGIIEHLQQYSDKTLDESLDTMLKKALDFSSTGDFADDVCLLALDVAVK